jgi:5-methylcytosine-specific restriction endonuclease McrA
MTRTEFSKKTQRQAWGRANGRCELCGLNLRIGNIHYDHIIPDRMGGRNDLDNAQVLCVPCHKAKGDHAKIAKTKRQEDMARGIKQPKGRPLPGTKASGIRKRMNGHVERWT